MKICAANRLAVEMEAEGLLKEVVGAKNKAHP
jgi:hypothetical protein